MARIKSKNTQPELIVRSILHRLGYRYSLHGRHLPGSPDLVFTSREKVIFVNGCFWHGHQCPRGRAQSKTNIEYWSTKIAANRTRDQRVRRQLNRLGWGTLTIWECQVRRGNWLLRALRFLENTMVGL